MNYTKGPWGWEWLEREVQGSVHDCWVSSEGWPVAMVNNPAGQEATEANARLIAAAPDMLERLEFTLEDLNTIIDNAEFWTSNEIRSHAMGVQTLISNTISKAKGE